MPMKRAKPQPQRRSVQPQARRPLLVIDGDSFAHRAYHALPKNILRDGGHPAGAILGFANRLLQLYRTERPRAVLVGWDTLEAATYRHDAFADYQSGREFDDDLVEQLALIPKFVAACGFANAKCAGCEADDFLAAAACANAMGWNQARCRTSSRCAAIRPTNCQERRASARKAPPHCCAATAASTQFSKRDALGASPTICGSTAPSRL